MNPFTIAQYLKTCKTVFLDGILAKYGVPELNYCCRNCCRIRNDIFVKILRDISGISRAISWNTYYSDFEPHASSS